MRLIMTEKGKIREIRENLITVAPDKSAACFGCMDMECKTNGGFITAENSFGLNLKTGQMVEVRAPGSGILVQAMAALLPPALGFAAGYTLPPILFPAAGEWLGAAMGMFFLFASAFIIYRVRKKFPAPTEYTVTKILE